MADARTPTRAGPIAGSAGAVAVVPATRAPSPLLPGAGPVEGGR